MLRALVEAAERFRREGKLPPTGYKPKVPKWIIRLDDEKPRLEGPYTKKEIGVVYAPDRQRSSTKPPPFLLLDKAKYVLGIPKGSKANALHDKYFQLLEQAARETKEPSLDPILDFVKAPQLDDIDKIKPDDLVAIKVEPDRYPFEIESVQQFWVRYLNQNLIAEHKATCLVCGRKTDIFRILPREIVILGQKCQITSFNEAAFRSFGRKQTTNSPICFDCANKAIDALDYLSRDMHHYRRLWSNPKAGNTLENQLAVFWLDKRVEFSFKGKTYDFEDLLSLPIGDIKEQTRPPATLSQLEELLAIPQTAREAALKLDERHFYLAVLSANKGRLIVREWMDADLGRIRGNLARFLHATRIVSPWGDPPRPQSIATLLQALGAANPNFTRGLLRTAYLGYAPPSGLLGAAVNRFRTLTVPRTREAREESWRLQALASAMKFVLFYGKEEMEMMDQLNAERTTPAYLCGRLLAILEQAQLRASNFKIKQTIVGRSYGAASTAPATVFGGLIRLATVAHLPKVGQELRERMEEVMSKLDAAGGLPRTLTLAQQAEFALGFYHERAALRAESDKQEQEKETDNGGAQ